MGFHARPNKDQLDLAYDVSRDIVRELNAQYAALKVDVDDESARVTDAGRQIIEAVLAKALAQRGAIL